MANAIRSITIGRGLDPRNFVIVAFGGAGPLHAAAIAEELGIRRVVVPASAGVFSAWGMLQADLRHEAVQTVMWRVDEEVDRNVDAAFDALRERLQGLLAAEGVDDEERTYIRSFDMRYLGQEYYISVPIDDPQGRGAYRGWEDVRRRFGRLYEERYGHQNENEEAEIVNIRMEGVGRLRRSGSPVLPTGGPRQRLPRPGMGGVSTAPDRGRHVSRDTIDTEERLNGPVVISEMSCTTYVPPGWIARVDADRHLWLERTTGEDE